MFRHHMKFTDPFSPQFEGAYRILTDAEESGDISTVSLYNAIMLGYFREVNSRVICCSFDLFSSVTIQSICPF
jgi:hypothetical protein